MTKSSDLNSMNSNEDLLSQVVGCSPIRLEEAHLSELRSLIAKLPMDNEKIASQEANLDRFKDVIKLYCDEPKLLDSALPELVDQLVRHINWPSPDQSDGGELDPLTKAALARVKVLSSVRGYKYLMRFLPHTIELLEPVLIALKYLANNLSVSVNQVPRHLDPSSSSTSTNPLVDKEILHVLVIWLMIICKNPFNLARVQTTTNKSSSPKANAIPEQIVGCLDAFMERTNMDGGLGVLPTLLAQILTRNQDNQQALSARFDQFQRVFQKLESELDGGRELINQISLANNILKLGHRHEVKPFAQKLLQSLPSKFIRAQFPNILVRNLIAKLLQRIALVLLRPRLAPWRYQCGYRSLEENLKRAKQEQNAGTSAG